MKRFSLYLAVSIVVAATFMFIIATKRPNGQPGKFISSRVMWRQGVHLSQLTQASSVRDSPELQRVVDRKSKERDDLAWLPERTGLYHYKLILPAVEHDETIEEAQALVAQAEGHRRRTREP